jgi:hypothetical protein
MREKQLGRSSIVSSILQMLPAFAWLTTLAPDAGARPGTHPVVVSTWDARASSVVLGYRHGSLDSGSLNMLSYHANFSSTGGKLSSQFGLYYLNLSSDSEDPTAHGLAGSATAVFNLPVTRRFDNGLPLTAIDFYVGSAPTALISGERNYLTLPLTIGVGVPITPVKAISIIPWFEFSPSVNLDTEIHDFHIAPADADKYVTVNQMTGEVKVDFTSSDVENLIGETVDLKASAAVGARAGLDIALHASDYFDFTANVGLSSFGSAFSGTQVLYLGGGLIWRWDDIVPAVLPAERRLLHESCDDVELRFKSCPNSKNWRSPEETQRLYGPRPSAAPTSAPAAPSPSQVPAAAPPPSPAPTPTPAPAPASPNSAPPPPTPPSEPAPGVSGSFPG